jgi:DNA-binding protein HU-beta
MERYPIPGGSMTREELARDIARRTGLTLREVQSVLGSMLDVITETLCAGDSIYMRGFGCFETRRGRMRRARNPQGEGVIEIPPRIRPHFRPYDALKDAVQQSLASRVRVDFLCLGARNAEYVSVIGSFNDWDETECPMQKLPDGSWVAELILPAGQTIRYRYNVDGRWEVDPAYPADSQGNTVRQT